MAVSIADAVQSAVGFAVTFTCFTAKVAEGGLTISRRPVILRAWPD